MYMNREALHRLIETYSKSPARREEASKLAMLNVVENHLYRHQQKIAECNRKLNLKLYRLAKRRWQKLQKIQYLEVFSQNCPQK